jgi:hypothetical protein
LALFVFPSGNSKHLDNLNETDEHDFHGSLLEWGYKKMAWGILLLWRGLALADALENAGLIKPGRLVIAICRRRFYAFINGGYHFTIYK